MGGLGLRMVGGALAGIGDGILADAKAKKETMLLQLEHQLRSGEQATGFQNQQTLEQMKLDAQGNDIQTTMTDDQGSIVGITKTGQKRDLGIRAGKTPDPIKDKFQDKSGNWYGLTESGKKIDLGVEGKPTEPDKAPPSREVTRGDQTVTEEYRNGAWTEVGRGPRFKPEPVDQFAGGGVGGASQIHGDEYLKTLPANVATTVKALSDGRLSFPVGAALRSDYWQKMLEAVGQYDPAFDAVNYNARSKTRGDFTSGKSAVNIKSLNTAIGHLGTLNSQIAGTAGHEGFPGATLVNRGVNAYERSSGDPGITNFEQTAGALASELTTVFRGTGGAEADVARYLSQLNPNASETQKKAAIKNITDLLDSRLQAIGDQYNQGMGKTSDPLMLLSNKAAETLQALREGKSTAAQPAAQQRTVATSGRPSQQPEPLAAPNPAAPTRATIPAPQNLLSEPDGTIVEDDQHRRYEKRGSQLIPR